MQSSKQSSETLSSSEYVPKQMSHLLAAGSSAIWKLPVEVLEIIFMSATENTTFAPNYYSQKKCVKIALVCRWWSRVVERLLFSNIVGSLGTSLIHWEIHLIDKLLRLEEAPYRYNLVRLVRIFIDKSRASTQEIGIVLRGLTACRNIRSLSLTWDFEEYTYPFLKCVKQLPLRYLRLRNLYHGIPINIVSEFFNIPTLDQVSLGGYGWSKKDILAIKNDEGTIGLTDEEVQNLPLPSFEQFRGVKSIHLIEPWTHPLVTQHLLSWPCRLEELSIFDLWEIEPYGSQYTSATIVRLLDKHRDSLKKLSIDWMPGQEQQIADFSGFVQLEHLYISAYCLLRFPASTVWPRIIPRNLRSLVLDFNSDFGNVDASALFGEGEFNWIQEFLFRMRSKNPHSKLKDISINFGGRGDPGAFWACEDNSYPHRYLVKAVEAARKQGVLLRYTEPVTYDEPWNVIARDMPPPVRTDDLDNDIYTMVQTEQLS